MPGQISKEAILRSIPAVFGVRPQDCTVRPLRGGLESSVAAISFCGERGTKHAVVKRLEGAARREERVYRAVWREEYAPELYGSTEENGVCYLFIEHVRAVQSWPWRDYENTAIVMRQLPELHGASQLRSQLPAWDYESDLLASARETIAVAESEAHNVPELSLNRHLSLLRRLAAALPDLRMEVRERYGSAMLHGDAHPGNVRLRQRNGRRTAVFLDWARSRRGSPFEDVSSWLQTLRYWEPAAARDHDRLLREYLVAAGRGPALDEETRRAYWISGAGNVFAGALRYHILRAGSSRGATRRNVLGQALDALRVIRRADALVRR
ncbi:MAG TPA: phosphotransferase [Thermoanaerobaculia bacterium]